MEVLIAWALASTGLTLIFLAVRAALRNRISLRVRYALWIVVAARLLIPAHLPFSLPVPADLLPQTQQAVIVDTQPVQRPIRPATTEAPVSGTCTVTPIAPSAAVTAVTPASQSRSLAVKPAQLLSVLWLAGTLAVLGITLVSNRLFLRRLRRTSQPLKAEHCPLPVYLTRSLASPCLVGLLHPVICLNEEAVESPERLRHVLAHELTHWHHRDPLWSLLRCLCLALHWYNPLVWYACRLSRRDGEMACDEGAVELLGESQRLAYGRTLVDLTPRRGCAPLIPVSAAMITPRSNVRARVELLVRHPHTTRRSLVAALLVLSISLLLAFSGCSASPANAREDCLNSLVRVTEATTKGAKEKDFTIRTTMELENTTLVVADNAKNSKDTSMLLLGVWDKDSLSFLGDTVLLQGEGADCCMWAEDGNTYLFCAAPSVTFGSTRGAAPLWLRFTIHGLEPQTELPAIAKSANVPLPEDEDFFDPDSEYWQTHKVEPEATGFTLYERPEDSNDWISLGTVLLTDSHAALQAGAASSGNTADNTTTTRPETAVTTTDDGRIGKVNLTEGAITIPDWPQYSFTWEDSADKRVLAAEENGTRIWEIRRVKEAWLCDLNGDGERELCMIRCVPEYSRYSFITVVDSKTGTYHLDCRLPGGDLTLEPKDGTLNVYWEYGINTGEGPLVLTDDGLSSSACPNAISLKDGFMPGDFPLYLEFCSGAGAWDNAMLLASDYTFQGIYSNADMADVQFCAYHGRFSLPQPRTDTTWTMTLEDLTLDTGHAIGETWDEGKLHMTAAQPYGLDDNDGNTLQPGTEFLLVSPDTPMNEMKDMEVFLSWHWTTGEWGLCATETQKGFVSMLH